MNKDIKTNQNEEKHFFGFVKILLAIHIRFTNNDVLAPEYTGYKYPEPVP